MAKEIQLESINLAPIGNSTPTNTTMSMTISESQNYLDTAIRPATQAITDASSLSSFAANSLVTSGDSDKNKISDFFNSSNIKVNEEWKPVGDTFPNIPNFINDLITAHGGPNNTAFSGLNLISSSGSKDYQTNWTPSLLFPSFVCINRGLFGLKPSGNSKPTTELRQQFPKFIIFENKNLFDYNIKECKKYFPNPQSDIKEVSKKLTIDIKNILYDKNKSKESNIFKFLVWTAMIDYIKPLQKQYKEDLSIDPLNTNNLYYFSKYYLFPFPESTTILTANDIFNIAFEKFIKFVKECIDRKGESISLFNDFISNDSKDLLTLPSKRFLEFFKESANININAYPGVIDSKFGNYSTHNSICSAIVAIDRRQITCNGNQQYTINMEEYDAMPLQNKGQYNIALPFFNAYTYSDIFAKAFNELFSLPSWKDYNTCAKVNFIIDKWTIDAQQNSHLTGKDTNASDVLTNTSLITGESYDSLEKRTSYDLNVMGDAAELSKNDIRSVIRKSRKRSLYGLSDYNWSMNSMPMTNLDPNSYQRLDIFEFQPDRQISYKRFADGLITTLSGIMNSANAIVGNTAVVAAAAATALAEVRNQTTGIDVDSVKQYASNVSWVDQLLDGYWVGQYTVPYFGDKYLEAATSSGWSMGNLLGNKNFVVDDLTLNAQDIPTWKFNAGNEDDEMNFKFCLLNDNLDNIIKNYRFLFAFIAGAYWLQDNEFSYRTPNLYRVFCPGRFVMLYAAMDVKVKYIGKIHSYSSADAQKMFGLAQNADEFKRFYSAENECNIPEAFEISVKFKNLTPQAFNIFASYQTAAESHIYPKITTQKITGHRVTYKNAISKAQTMYNNMKDAYSNSEMINDVKNSVINAEAEKLLNQNQTRQDSSVTDETQDVPTE